VTALRDSAEVYARNKVAFFIGAECLKNAGGRQMKIYYERSGGFMGRTVMTVVDTNELPPKEALTLLESIEESDFFQLSATIDQGLESVDTIPDELCYRVTVEVAGVQHSVETSDSSTPPELQRLISELDRLARQAR
jgi:hypothetical protein